MRTFIKTISLSFIMIAISCSKEVAEPNANQNNNPDRTSYSISIDDLHAYLTEQSTTVLTKGSSFDIQPITSKKDTVLYMVNYEDGWEVFSADKRAPRVFAKAETGSISESDFKEIPALKCLYESFVENVKYLKNNPEVKPSTNFVDSWDLPGVSKSESNNDERIRTRSESVVTQPHLLQTKWGQGYPWNIRAPYTDVTLQTHCLTGCGPVAMAQVMYYLQSIGCISYDPYADSYTTKYILGNSNSDYIRLHNNDVSFVSPTGSPSSVWNSMPLDSLDTGSGKSFEAVSTLMIDLGINTLTEYYRYKTSTWSGYVADAFTYNYFFPTNYGAADLDDLADLILQDNLPAILLVRHQDNAGNVSDRHYLVADAIKEYYQNPGGELLSRYIGFNWGWDGLCDDYWFSTDALNWFANGTVFNDIFCMIYIVSI